jgi:tetratricopeptide (TPR) repeat protein
MMASWIFSRSEWSVLWVLCSLAGALVLTLLALLFGAFRFGAPVLHGSVRKAVLESNAALAEGKPGEALEIVEKAVAERENHPWLLIARGQSLLFLGRLDAAAECLALALPDRFARPTAAYLLGFAEILRGNTARAEELARSIVEESPRNALAWLLLGCAAAEAGKNEEAEAHLGRSCELVERNAVALAKRVVCVLERGAPPGETDAWMDAARLSDPRLPDVLAASARWRLARGEVDLARAEMDEAVAELKRRGMFGWIPWFERAARSWGLTLDSGPALA